MVYKPTYNWVAPDCNSGPNNHTKWDKSFIVSWFYIMK